MRFPFSIWAAGVSAVLLGSLVACGDSGGQSSASGGSTTALATGTTEEPRPQDARSFTMDPNELPFGPMQGVTVETDRWWGMLGNSGYRIEVPKAWNGTLVMWAHGYEGSSSALDVNNPPMRRYLIEHGYAWAASSFSKNNYDVRAGVEDTNALALSFTMIASLNKRSLAPPTRTYIAGGSMGGHIAAAAVEMETEQTANNKKHYDAALPLCGPVGDTALFDYFGAYQLAAQYLGGHPAASWPVTNFQTALREDVENNLWFVYPSLPKDAGRKLENIVMNLTGGNRPAFSESFKVKLYQDPVWDQFGDDGTITGIFTKNVIDTAGIVYQLDDAPALNAEEAALNQAIARAVAAPDANRLRTDGLRWVPKVNGQVSVPVLTLHTLGDLYVPFSMEQIYRQRATANGNGQWLVQRAIRATGHCEFTVAEQTAAFEGLVRWEQTGVKPAGDDVVTPAVVSQPNYGCAFTNNATGPDDDVAIRATRALVPAC